MNNLLLPDLFAMVVLLCVLWRVRRRYPQHDIRLWMAGLLLILLECVARVLYAIPMSRGPHRTLHTIALDAYLFAGLLFLRSAVAGLRRLPRANLYSVLYTAPCVVLLTVYGLDVRSRSVYVAITLGGMLVAVASSLALQRPNLYVAGMAAMWMPAAFGAWLYTPRMATYLLLAAVYLATAASFVKSLPLKSSGKLAVVTGFTLWAACFATHPWIAETHPAWNTLASEVWNMQKFLITVGFLLVLFERQVESNEWLALHDQLTGLPNRRLFQDRIGSAIARAERDGTALILFYMDLNSFKEVNDTMGHDAGDALLRKVAENLQQVVRRTDTLARMGGDEFILLATDVRTERSRRKEGRWMRPRDGEPEQEAGYLQTYAEEGQDRASQVVQTGTGLEVTAGRVAAMDGRSRVVQQVGRIEQTIRAAVDRPVKLWSPAGTRMVQISASVGVAMYPLDSTDPDDLCRIADQRMYEDKTRESDATGSLDRVLSLWTAT